MATTTLRLPPTVRARIDKLAAASGKSTHAFMVVSLTDSAERMERQQAFDAEVQRRWTKYARNGEYYALEDARDFILARARGEAVERPEPRKLPSQDLVRLRARAR